MRIAHITGYFNEKVAYQENMLTKGQVELGHEVYVLTSNLLIELPGQKDSRLMPVGEFDYEGVKLIRTPFTVEIKKNSLIHYKSVLKNLRKIKPDYIFIHDKGLYVFPILFYKLFINKKVMIRMDFHSDFTNSMNSKLGKLYHGFFRYYFKLFGFTFNKYYFIAPEMGRFIRAVYKVPEYKCELLRLPGDASGVANFTKQELRVKWKFEGGKTYIVHSGKMPAGKKTAEVLDAIQGTDIKAILLGSITGTGSEALQQKINQNPNAIHLGWRTPQEIRELIKASDILVQPGTLSNTFVEAVCIGTPLLLDDTPQGRDLVASENGMLISKEITPENIREGIATIMANQDEYIQKARESKTKFDYMTISKQTVEI